MNFIKNSQNSKSLYIFLSAIVITILNITLASGQSTIRTDASSQTLYKCAECTSMWLEDMNITTVGDYLNVSETVSEDFVTLLVVSHNFTYDLPITVTEVLDDGILGKPHTYKNVQHWESVNFAISPYCKGLIIKLGTKTIKLVRKVTIIPNI